MTDTDIPSSSALESSSTDAVHHIPDSYSMEDLESMYEQADAKETETETGETLEADSESQEVSETDGNDDTPSKTYKARDGDKDFEINEDAVIFKKVDGKEIPVKIKDALDEFAGKTAYDRKFQELDTERKGFQSERQAFHAERESVNTNFGKIAEVAAAGQPQAALRLLAEMSGQDPVEFEKSYLENFGKIFQTYLKMTPQDKELYFSRQREKQATQQLEKLNTERTAEQSKATLRSEVASAAESIGITFDEFGQLFNELAGTIKDRDITVDDVKKYHNHIQAFTLADKVMQTAGVSSNETVEATLVRIILSDPEMTENDLVDIVKAQNRLPTPSEENLNRKVQKAAQSGNRTASTPQASSKKENQEPESWDDL